LSTFILDEYASDCFPTFEAVSTSTVWARTLSVTVVAFQENFSYCGSVLYHQFHNILRVIMAGMDLQELHKNYWENMGIKAPRARLEVASTTCFLVIMQYLWTHKLELSLHINYSYSCNLRAFIKKSYEASVMNTLT
jgi:hypothetical protein